MGSGGIVVPPLHQNITGTGFNKCMRIFNWHFFVCIMTTYDSDTHGELWFHISLIHHKTKCVVNFAFFLIHNIVNCVVSLEFNLFIMCRVLQLAISWIVSHLRFHHNMSHCAVSFVFFFFITHQIVLLVPRFSYHVSNFVMLCSFLIHHDKFSCWFDIVRIHHV